MLINDLFETADNDALRSALADRFLQGMRNHLYTMMKAGETLPTTIFQTRDLPCLPAGDFDCPAMFKQVLVVFQDDFYGGSGKAIMKKYPMGGYSYILFLETQGDSVEEIWKSLSYDRIQDVVRHELQHITDYKRWKTGDIFDARGVSASSGMDKKQSPQAYHNDDLELNAFFHNIAEPLLARVRFIQAHGAEMAGIYPDMTRDFREWLADRVRSLHGMLKRHWANLREANKRRAISRLKALFDLYWQIIDAHEQNKYPDTPSEV